jgi:hypothetical protein
MFTRLLQFPVLFYFGPNSAVQESAQGTRRRAAGIPLALVSPVTQPWNHL